MSRRNGEGGRGKWGEGREENGLKDEGKWGWGGLGGGLWAGGGGCAGDGSLCLGSRMKPKWGAVGWGAEKCGRRLDFLGAEGKLWRVGPGTVGSCWGLDTGQLPDAPSPPPSQLQGRGGAHPEGRQLSGSHRGRLGRIAGWGGVRRLPLPVQTRAHCGRARGAGGTTGGPGNRVREGGENGASGGSSW